MNLLAIVTARGGSKGFPGKNMAQLAGRPLVAWSHALLATFRSRHPGTKLWLSTDSSNIASAWPAADVPHRLRPPELATDISSSLDVILHELVEGDKEGFHADSILLIQPTSPLISIDDLEAAWSVFEDGADSVVGMVPAHHPVQWTFKLDSNGTLYPFHDTPDTVRRQDLPQAFLPVGFYFARRTFIEAHRSFLVCEHTRGIVVPAERGVDVDRSTDLDAIRGILSGHPIPTIHFGSKQIGPLSPCYVIAEAGVNHNGSLDRAIAMVYEAARAGADAVKFQTFKAEDLVTQTTRMAVYQATNTQSSSSQFEMLRALELDADAFVKIQKACQDIGIQFLSTPFGPESAALLAEMNVDGFKVSSGDLTDLPFLRQLASYRKPIILSTGMGTLQEVEEAVDAVRCNGNPPLILLHCLSAYPAPPDQYNLKAMQSLQDIFHVPVGLSDHSLGMELAIAAVALGGKVIEKHFTLDRGLPGPDHVASLEPADLARYISAIRLVESSIGDGMKRPMPAEADAREVARKSLVFATALPKGAVILASHLRFKRPGSGIPTRDMERVLGRTLARNVDADSLVSWDDLSECS
jgi:N,N'-diacetyllegionaminate synthase